MSSGEPSRTILREATEDDLRPLAAFVKRELDALGIRHTISTTRLRRIAARHRFVLLIDEGKLVAGLMAHPMQTDEGHGFLIELFVVARDCPDKIKALDALSLYACNIVASERGYVIESQHSTRAGPIIYGRDYLGMDAVDEGIDPDTGEVLLVRLRGDARAIIKRILERRPEWRP